MAVTKITTTGNLKAAVDYITSTKPHHASKLVHERVLESASLNGSTNPKAFIKQGLDTLPKGRKKKAIRKIISFNSKKLPIWKPGSVQTAIAITKRADKRQFPNSQMLIVAQADNKNHILHTHSLVINSDLRTGKAVTPLASWKQSTKYTDEACKHFGFQPSTTPNRSRDITNSAAIHRRQANNYSYLFDLRQRINSALFHSASLNEYCSQLVKHGVYMRLFRRSHGKLHVYQTPGSINIPYQNGFLRLKKHFTYDFRDQTGQTRVIRQKKLGTDTDRGHVMHVLHYNATHTKNMGISMASYKKRSKRNFGRDKSKITLRQLWPTVKTRHYQFVDCGPQFSKTQKPTLKTSHEPLKHPLLHFQPQRANINALLGRLFYNLKQSPKMESKEERIAQKASIDRIKEKLTTKAYNAAIQSYKTRQFLLLEHQANKAAVAKYNYETKRSLWLQKQELEHYQQGPTW